MSHTDMDSVERQQDCEQAGQADMLQALRSASLPDDFWMYSYKILPCPHGYRHSWTHCPFSHVGETARRRCPRTHSYLPDPCVNARAKRQCPNGDACPYAHNTFEQWLHPVRYRTRLCYLGANCRRPTCFFAHSVEELRSVDENEAGGATPSAAMPMPLPPLPVPPPLLSPMPSPMPSAVMPPTGPSGEYGTALPQSGSGSGGAPHMSAMLGGPMGLMQPVVLMSIPQQPHQGMRPDMVPHGAVQCYMPYQARPTMLRPPTSMQLQGDAGPPQQMQMHMQMQMHPSGANQMAAVPVGVRPQATAVRPQHFANQTATVSVAAVRHPGSFVYVHSGMPPPQMPGGVSMHGQQPPPPPPQGYSSPFVTPGGYHRGGEGIPPSAGGPAPAGRMRSWSNPGETAYFFSSTHSLGGGSCSFNGGGGEQPPMWVSVDAGRRAAGLPTAVSAMMPSPRSVAMQASGRSVAATAAPRHMPAPTNRGGAVRRLSTPDDVSHSAAPAAVAAAAAAVSALHYPDPSGSAVSSPGLGPAGALQAAKQQQQQQFAADGMEAALRSMALSKPCAAPPPTPAFSNLAAGGSSGGSPYSQSHSASSTPQSRSAGGNAAGGTPVALMPLGCDGAVAAMAAAAAASARADLAILRARSSNDGTVAYSRPSSSGSATSVGTMLSAYDSSAAAALAAVTAGVESHTDAAAAVTVPYRTLLQHMLRSTSASSAEPPSGLLPALLSGVDSVHADLYYDDDADLMMERSSDPGPGGLHAAIRRISNEFGSAAATCRNSDPGHIGGPTSGSDVQQLLLPLLQSVLTEGLATGQFELVGGQLQLKNGGGGAVGGVSPRVYAAMSEAVAVAGGRSIEPTACVSSTGVNA